MNIPELFAQGTHERTLIQKWWDQSFCNCGGCKSNVALVDYCLLSGLVLFATDNDWNIYRVDVGLIAQIEFIHHWDDVWEGWMRHREAYSRTVFGGMVN